MYKKTNTYTQEGAIMLNKKEKNYLAARLAGIANASNDCNVSEALMHVIDELQDLGEIAKSTKCLNTTVVTHVRVPEFTAWRQQLIISYGLHHKVVPNYIANEAVSDEFVAWAVDKPSAVDALSNLMPMDIMYTTPIANLEAIFAALLDWEAPHYLYSRQITAFSTYVWRPEVIKYLLCRATHNDVLYDYINPGMSLPTVRYVSTALWGLDLDELECVDVIDLVAASMLETDIDLDDVSPTNYLSGWRTVDNLMEFLQTETRDSEELCTLIANDLCAKEDDDVVKFSRSNYVPVRVLRKYAAKHDCTLMSAWVMLQNGGDI